MAKIRISLVVYWLLVLMGFTHYSLALGEFCDNYMNYNFVNYSSMADLFVNISKSQHGTDGLCNFTNYSLGSVVMTDAEASHYWATGSMLVANNSADTSHLAISNPLNITASSCWLLTANFNRTTGLANQGPFQLGFAEIEQKSTLYYWSAGTDTDKMRAIKYNATNGQVNSADQTTGTTFHTYQIMWCSGNVSFWLDGTMVLNQTDWADNKKYVAFFAARKVGTSYWDYFRVENVSKNSAPTTGPASIANITANLTEQIPADINSSNLFDNAANITYFIKATGIPVKNSSVLLNMTTNTSTDDCLVFINGSCSRFLAASHYENDTTNFSFMLDDNVIYPARYMVNDSLQINTGHVNYSLGSVTAMMSMKFMNFSVKNYTFVEIQVARSSGIGNLRLYMCNDSYSTGNPGTSSNCFLFFLGVPTLNDTHYADNGTLNSWHALIIIPSNASSNTIGNISMTPNMTIIARGALASSYEIGTIPIDSNSVMVSNNNGATWAPYSSTPDAHVHIFNDGATFHYQACASDVGNNATCSAWASDVLGLDYLPPSQPTIISPEGGTSYGSVTILYQQSFSPNGFNVSNYTVEIWNSTYAYIVQNQTLYAASLLANLTNFSTGDYYINVTACDTNVLCSTSTSDLFTIFSTYPSLDSRYPDDEHLFNGTNVNPPDIKAWCYFTDINLTYVSIKAVHDNGTVRTLAAYPNATSYNISLTFPPYNGTYWWVCNASNGNAGYTTTGANRTFNVSIESIVPDYQTIDYQTVMKAFWGNYAVYLLPMFTLCLIAFVFGGALAPTILAFGLFCPLFFLFFGNAVFIILGIACILGGFVMKYLNI